MENLYHLKLDDNKIQEIQGLDALENLGELSMCRNRITVIKGLKHLGNLGYINLSGNLLPGRLNRSYTLECDEDFFNEFV